MSATRERVFLMVVDVLEAGNSASEITSAICAIFAEDARQVREAAALRVKELEKQLATVISANQSQAGHASEVVTRLAEAERERDAARTAAQSLHGLVESACLYWRGSMPVPTENESMAVAQDRLTERDLIRKADVWVSTLAPTKAPTRG